MKPLADDMAVHYATYKSQLSMHLGVCLRREMRKLFEEKMQGIPGGNEATDDPVLEPISKVLEVENALQQLVN